MDDAKNTLLVDALTTAIEFSKKCIILKRVVIVQCVIIACLIARLILR